MPRRSNDLSLERPDLTTQFWTSRGIAVLDVNYGGSTGFGRDFRNRLHLNWGIVDVEDCINGAKFLVAEGLVDHNRIVIRGGSAGGYTTLAALTFRDFFQGGASYYGISDLAVLARETHKFESRYLDWLIGPYVPKQHHWVADALDDGLRLAVIVENVKPGWLPRRAKYVDTRIIVLYDGR